MPEQNEFETGVEKNSDIENDPYVADHDWFAFADDGEHAMVWGVDRVGDDTVEITYYYCESGLVYVDPNGSDRFRTDVDESTEDFAREVANAAPELWIGVAREHFC